MHKRDPGLLPEHSRPCEHPVLAIAWWLLTAPFGKGSPWQVSWLGGRVSVKQLVCTCSCTWHLKKGAKPKGLFPKVTRSDLPVCIYCLETCKVWFCDCYICRFPAFQGTLIQYYSCLKQLEECAFLWTSQKDPKGLSSLDYVKRPKVFYITLIGTQWPRIFSLKSGTGIVLSTQSFSKTGLLYTFRLNICHFIEDGRALTVARAQNNEWQRPSEERYLASQVEYSICLNNFSLTGQSEPGYSPSPQCKWRVQGYIQTGPIKRSRVMTGLLMNSEQ